MEQRRVVLGQPNTQEVMELQRLLIAQEGQGVEVQQDLMEQVVMALAQQHPSKLVLVVEVVEEPVVQVE